MYKEVNELRKGYKETEIGLLPADWEVVELNKVAHNEPNSFVDGPFGSSLKVKDFFEKGPVRVIQLQNIADGGFVDTNKKYINETKCNELNRHITFPGDIVIAKMADPVGRACMVPYLAPRYMIVADCMRLRPSDKVDPFYVVNVINSPFVRRQAISLATGATRQRVSLTNMKRLRIPLPPLSEQQQIAYVLSTIQSAIELQDRVIAAARELKRSLMRHLFSYGPVPVDQIDHIPLMETEIGPVPEHWEVVELDYLIVNCYSGGTPSTKEDAYWGGSVPWTTSALMEENEIFLNRYQKLITERALNESSAQLAPKGSLLLGTRVGVGKAAIASFDIAVSQDITVLRVDTRKILIEFFAYSFKADLIKDCIEGRVRGTTIKGIARNDVLTLPVPLPPLSEQQQIADILIIIDNKINTEEKRKSTLQALFQTILHLLMTGTVRVNDLEVKEDALRR